MKDDRTYSITTSNTTGKMNSFFRENYDHENVSTNTDNNDGTIMSNEIKQRKSVSARFRSISRDTM